MILFSNGLNTLAKHLSSTVLLHTYYIVTYKLKIIPFSFSTTYYHNILSNDNILICRRFIVRKQVVK